MAMNVRNTEPRFLRMTHPGIYQDEADEKWVTFLKYMNYILKILFWKTDEIPIGYEGPSSIGWNRPPQCLTLDSEHMKYVDEEGAMWNITYFGSGFGITTLVVQTVKNEE